MAVTSAPVSILKGTSVLPRDKVTYQTLSSFEVIASRYTSSSRTSEVTSTVSTLESCIVILDVLQECGSPEGCNVAPGELSSRVISEAFLEKHMAP